MSVKYELWLTDDRGNRIALLADFGEPTFFNYTRGTSQLGTLSLGVPFQPFKKKFNPYFRPDWRVEVWRSAAYGVPMRREDVFLLRKPNVYIRKDNVEILQLYGRNGVDLLNRRSVIQRGGTSYAKKTDFADDMMKEIVRQQMLYGSALDEDGVVDNTRAWPQGEFSVQADAGVGPSMSLAFPDKKVYDVLKEIRDTTFQLNEDSSSSRRIYFDMVPVSLSATAAPSGSFLGWEFRTYADLWGHDRTGNGIIFSVENENLKTPSYDIDYLDEVNSIFVRGNGSGNSQIVVNVTATNRIAASRWNMSEKVLSASGTPSNSGLQSAGQAELRKGKPKENFQGELLNTPGRSDVPQSLYGIDWDLGDLIRAEYANKQFDAEINLVYVSVDDKGKEEITGRTEVRR